MERLQAAAILGWSEPLGGSGECGVKSRSALLGRGYEMLDLARHVDAPIAEEAH
jgi:hypothetical protein